MAEIPEDILQNPFGTQDLGAVDQEQTNLFAQATEPQPEQPPQEQGFTSWDTYRNDPNFNQLDQGGKQQLFNDWKQDSIGFFSKVGALTTENDAKTADDAFNRIAKEESLEQTRVGDPNYVEQIIEQGQSGLNSMESGVAGYGAAIGAADPTRAAEIIAANNLKTQNRYVSPEMREYGEKAKTAGDVVRYFFGDIKNVMVPVFAQSMGSNLPAMATSLGVGVGVGAAASPPVGAVAGLITSAGLGGMTDTLVSFDQRVGEEVKKRGLNPLDSKDIETVLRDPEFTKEAATYAEARGLAITATELATLGMGKILSTPAKAIGKVAFKEVAKEFAKDTALQVIAEPAGEALAQVAAQVSTGQEIKLSGKDIAEEALAGLPSNAFQGALMTVSNLTDNKAPISAGEVTRQGLENLVSGKYEQILKEGATEEGLATYYNILSTADKAKTIGTTPEIPLTNEQGTYAGLSVEEKAKVKVDFEANKLAVTKEIASTVQEAEAGVAEAFNPPEIKTPEVPQETKLAPEVSTPPLAIAPEAPAIAPAPTIAPEAPTPVKPLVSPLPVTPEAKATLAKSAPATLQVVESGEAKAPAPVPTPEAPAPTVSKPEVEAPVAVSATAPQAVTPPVAPTVPVLETPAPAPVTQKLPPTKKQVTALTKLGYLPTDIETLDRVKAKDILSNQIPKIPIEKAQKETEAVVPPQGQPTDGKVDQPVAPATVSPATQQAEQKRLDTAEQILKKRLGEVTAEGGEFTVDEEALRAYLGPNPTEQDILRTRATIRLLNYALADVKKNILQNGKGLARNVTKLQLMLNKIKLTREEFGSGLATNPRDVRNLDVLYVNPERLISRLQKGLTASPADFFVQVVGEEAMHAEHGNAAYNMFISITPEGQTTDENYVKFYDAQNEEIEQSLSLDDIVKTLNGYSAIDTRGKTKQQLIEEFNQRYGRKGRLAEEYLRALIQKKLMDYTTEEAVTGTVTRPVMRTLGMIKDWLSDFVGNGTLRKEQKTIVDKYFDAVTSIIYDNPMREVRAARDEKNTVIPGDKVLAASTDPRERIKARLQVNRNIDLVKRVNDDFLMKNEAGDHTGPIWLTAVGGLIRAFPTMKPEDIQSIVSVPITKAIGTFDGTRGTTLSTHLFTAGRSAILKEKEKIYKERVARGEIDEAPAKRTKTELEQKVVKQESKEEAEFKSEEEKKDQAESDAPTETKEEITSEMSDTEPQDNRANEETINEQVDAEYAKVGKLLEEDQEGVEALGPTKGGVPPIEAVPSEYLPVEAGLQGVDIKKINEEIKLALNSAEQEALDVFSSFPQKVKPSVRNKAISNFEMQFGPYESTLATALKKMRLGYDARGLSSADLARTASVDPVELAKQIRIRTAVTQLSGRYNFPARFTTTQELEADGVEVEKFASAMSKLQKLRINPTPIMLNFLQRYENKIDWNTVKTSSNLKEYAEDVWSSLIDATNYRVAPKDINFSLEENALAALAIFNADARRALEAYRENKEQNQLKILDYINQQRIESVSEWRDEIYDATESIFERIYARVLLWTIPDTALNAKKAGGSTIMAVPSLVQTVLNKINENGLKTVNVEKLYRKMLTNMAAQNVAEKIEVSPGKEWVYIPSKSEDPINFKSNVEKLKQLSASAWCTKTFNAEPYLQRGGFWIYLEDQSAFIAIRKEGDQVKEIQDIQNRGIKPIPDSLWGETISLLKKKDLYTGASGLIKKAGRMSIEDFVATLKEVREINDLPILVNNAPASVALGKAVWERAKELLADQTERLLSNRGSIFKSDLSVEQATKSVDNVYKTEVGELFINLIRRAGELTVLEPEGKEVNEMVDWLVNVQRVTEEQGDKKSVLSSPFYNSPGSASIIEATPFLSINQKSKLIKAFAMAPRWASDSSFLESSYVKLEDLEAYVAKALKNPNDYSLTAATKNFNITPELAKLILERTWDPESPKLMNHLIRAEQYENLSVTSIETRPLMGSNEELTYTKSKPNELLKVMFPFLERDIPFLKEKELSGSAAASEALSNINYILKGYANNLKMDTPTREAAINLVLDLVNLGGRRSLYETLTSIAFDQAAIPLWINPVEKKIQTLIDTQGKGTLQERTRDAGILNTFASVYASSKSNGDIDDNNKSRRLGDKISLISSRTGLKLYDALAKSLGNIEEKSRIAEELDGDFAREIFLNIGKLANNTITDFGEILDEKTLEQKAIDSFIQNPHYLAEKKLYILSNTIMFRTTPKLLQFYQEVLAKKDPQDVSNFLSRSFTESVFDMIFQTLSELHQARISSAREGLQRQTSIPGSEELIHSVADFMLSVFNTIKPKLNEERDGPYGITNTQRQLEYLGMNLLTRFTGSVFAETGQLVLGDSAPSLVSATDKQKIMDVVGAYPESMIGGLLQQLNKDTDISILDKAFKEKTGKTFMSLVVDYLNNTPEDITKKQIDFYRRHRDKTEEKLTGKALEKLLDTEKTDQQRAAFYEQQISMSPEGLEAFYDSKNADLVFVLDKIKSEQRGRQLFYHEATHGNVAYLEASKEGKIELEKILNGSRDLLLANADRLVTKMGFLSVQDFKNTYGFKNENEYLGELLARFAEDLADKPAPSWFAELINKLALWFKKYLNLDFNETDLTTWLADRMESAARGERLIAGTQEPTPVLPSITKGAFTASVDPVERLQTQALRRAILGMEQLFPEVAKALKTNSYIPIKNSTTLGEAKKFVENNFVDAWSADGDPMAAKRQMDRMLRENPQALSVPQKNAILAEISSRLLKATQALDRQIKKEGNSPEKAALRLKLGEDYFEVVTEGQIINSASGQGLQSASLWSQFGIPEVAVKIYTKPISDQQKLELENNPEVKRLKAEVQALTAELEKQAIEKAIEKIPIPKGVDKVYSFLSAFGDLEPLDGESFQDYLNRIGVPYEDLMSSLETNITASVDPVGKTSPVPANIKSMPANEAIATLLGLDKNLFGKLVGIRLKTGRVATTQEIDQAQQAKRNSPSARVKQVEIFQTIFNFFNSTESEKPTTEEPIEKDTLPVMVRLAKYSADAVTQRILNSLGFEKGKTPKGVFDRIELQIRRVVNDQFRNETNPQNATADDVRTPEERMLAIVERLTLAETIFNQTKTQLKIALDRDTRLRQANVEGQLNDAERKALEEAIAKTFDANKIGATESLVKSIVDFKAEARKSMSMRGATVRSLTKTILDKIPKITDQQAEALARLIVANYQQLVKASGEKQLAKLLSKVETRGKVAPKSEQTRMLELINLGAFDNEEFYNILAERYNLPSWNPEVVAEIKKRAEEQQALPEGSDQRLTKGLDLQSYIIQQILKSDKDKRVNRYRATVVSSLWKAGALSGPGTHIVNFYGTNLNVALELFSEAIGYYMALSPEAKKNTNPVVFLSDAFGEFFGAMGKGAEQGLDAFHTSYGRFRSETQKGTPILEAFKVDINKPWKASNYVALWKLVGRAMAASDTFNSVLANEAKLKMQVRYILLKSGLSEADTNAKVNDLFNSESSVNVRAQAQVDEEANAGQFGTLDGVTPGSMEYKVAGRKIEAGKRRRFEQLREIEISKEVDLSEEGAEGGNNKADPFKGIRHFTAVATFNSQPVGFIGFIAEKIAAMSAQVPLLTPFGSFTRTVANIVNAGLNYTPYGFLRANGFSIGNLFLYDTKYNFDKPDAKGYYKMATQASLGTAVLVAVAALVFDSIDDPWDEAKFAVTGLGPTNKAKRDQLRASGWAPNTVRFKGPFGPVQFRHADIPGFSLIFGAMGMMSDSIRYGTLNPEDKLQLAAYTAMSMGNVVFEKNLLSGTKSLFDILSLKEDPAKFLTRAAQSYTGGLANPGIFRWAGNTFRVNENGMITQIDYKNLTSSFWGNLMALTPVAVIAGKPMLNRLGEKVEEYPWAATTKRVGFVPEVKVHPVFAPLNGAGLFVPGVSGLTKVKVFEDGKLDQRRMTGEEYYDYSKFNGEYLKRMLTPERAQSLANLAKTNREGAQDQLESMAISAKSYALTRMEAQIRLNRKK